MSRLYSVILQPPHEKGNVVSSMHEFASPKACGQCLCHCTKYWGSHVCLASRKATSKRCTCREQLPECAEERHLEIETDRVSPWESSQGQCVGTVL